MSVNTEHCSMPQQVMMCQSLLALRVVRHVEELTDQDQSIKMPMNIFNYAVKSTWSDNDIFVALDRISTIVLN